MKKWKTHYCPYCLGAGMGCPECEHGVISEYVNEEEEKDAKDERPCTCGSGENWASCPENSSYCG